VGAGPLPRVDATDHPPRPPIPIVPVDDEAIGAARARDDGDLAVWLAGVTGAQWPVTARTIGAQSVLTGDEPALTVPQVARGVDAGRDLAARAAAEAIGLVIARSQDSPDPTPAVSVIAAVADDPGHPLRTLRRLGDEEIAVLCGVALGAGEHGMGCVCDGLAALAGAAVAAGIEPALRPRLRALGHHEQGARLGIATIDAKELAAALD
jgi:nicotinate-nucleotide--dimethylbenzimidazole phosphoribosyltransferase